MDEALTASKPDDSGEMLTLEGLEIQVEALAERSREMEKEIRDLKTKTDDRLSRMEREIGLMNSRWTSYLRFS